MEPEMAVEPLALRWVQPCEPQQRGWVPTNDSETAPLLSLLNCGREGIAAMEARLLSSSRKAKAPPARRRGGGDALGPVLGKNSYLALCPP